MSLQYLKSYKKYKFQGTKSSAVFCFLPQTLLRFSHSLFVCDVINVSTV